MTATLLVELDGQTVPLSKCAWVITEPCGCTSGIMTAQFADGTYTVATEEEAWRHFYEDSPEQGKRDRSAGVKFRLVGHEEGHRLIRSSCEHDPKWGRAPRPEVEGFTWAAPDSYSTQRRAHLHLVETAGVDLDARTRERPWASFTALCGKGETWWSTAWHRVDGRVTCLRCERKAAAR